MTLGPGAPAIGAGGEAATGSIDVAPVEFPLVSLAQHAGDEERLGAAVADRAGRSKATCR